MIPIIHQISNMSRLCTDCHAADGSTENYSSGHIKKYVKEIREERCAGYYGGVHPSERKEFSEHLSLKRFPEPKTVVISMSQHLGAPANPIVQVGDTVKKGQVLGIVEAMKLMNEIESEYDGTVKAILVKKWRSGRI